MGRGTWSQEGAPGVAQLAERGATPEDRSLRDSSRLDMGGGEGVAEQTSWGDERLSTWAVRKVTEGPMSFSMAISGARRGARAC